MLAQHLGFSSSWKMLTRDKGWIKPLLVLTLIGWIPIIGQMAVLGYGYEWARLTAWGVDATPKQRGVDYGKVLSTGARAWAVSILMGIVVSIVLSLLFGIHGGLFVFGMPWNVLSILEDMAGSFYLGGFGIVSLLSVAVSALSGTFVTAAMMRATLYDSFAAGWRIDRLFQMIARDFGGFAHVFLVSVIGGVLSAVYAWVAAAIFGIVAATGVVGFAASYAGAAHGFEHMSGEYLLRQVLSLGAGPVLVFVVLIILAIFVYGAISIAMQLIAINASGQWFCRFDVDRWGVSSAPLPDGVPGKGSGRGDRDANPPVMPDDMASRGPAGEGVVPAPQASGAPAPSADEQLVEAPASPVGEGFVEPAPESGSEASTEPAPAKGPIPLGPISTDGSAEDDSSPA